MIRVYSRRSDKYYLIQRWFIFILFVCCCLYVFRRTPSDSFIWWINADGIKISGWLPTLIYKILSLLAVAGNAILIYRQTCLYALFKKINMAPMMFYLLFCFCMPFLLDAYIQAVIFIFLFRTLSRGLCCLHEESLTLSRPYWMFALGFWCGCVSMTNVYLSFSMLTIYLTCYLLKVRSLRRYLQPLVGFLLPFVYGVGILYLLDGYVLDYDATMEAVKRIAFPDLSHILLQWKFSTGMWVCNILLALLTLISMIRIRLVLRGIVINLRKKYNLLIFVLLLSLGMIALMGQTPVFYGFPALLLSIILPITAQYFRRNWEYLSIAAFAAAVLIHFFISP